METTMPRHLPALMPELIEEPKETPWQVLEALAEVTGHDLNDAPEPWIRQQLGVAKRLLRDGYALVDIRGCAEWLVRTRKHAAVDLRNVLYEIGRWIFGGRPRGGAASHGALDARHLLQRAQSVRAGGD
jgi:hypothetical protein